MPKRPIIIISVLCVIALALGYWSGQEEQEVTSGSDVKSSGKTEPEFLEKGLVAYYPFNGNAEDESGNGHDGMVNGPILSNDRNGNPNSAYFFDSKKTDHILLPDHELIKTLRTNYSVSFWLWTRDVTQDSYIISKDGWGVGADQWYILFGYVDETISFGCCAGEEIHSSKMMKRDTWQHVVISHDGEDFKICFNGVNDTIRQRRLSLPRAEGRGVRFGGARGTSGSHFTGKLDDIRIYNRALSAEEVKALYEFEKAN